MKRVCEYAETIISRIAKQEMKLYVSSRQSKRARPVGDEIINDWRI